MCVGGGGGGRGGPKWKHHSEHYFLSFFSNVFRNILETWEIINLPLELTVWRRMYTMVMTVVSRVLKGY